MSLPTPIQCSDDLPAQAQPQTLPSRQPPPPPTPDLQQDGDRPPHDQTTQRDGTSRPVLSSDSGERHTFGPDEITLKVGDKIRIDAEGIARALQPGGVIQLGLENHLKIFRKTDDQGASRPKKVKNKYPLTESCAEPVIRHLDVISSGLATEWQQLGRCLGLQQSTLEQICLEYNAEGQHEINYRVLVKWKQMSGCATLKMLAEALVDIGRGDLADELRKG